MRTVRDDAGRRYLLVKRSGESSLVRDPETGAERYLPSEDIEETGEDPLAAAARAVAAPERRLLRAVHDDATLGLVVALSRRGPQPVRDLLAWGEQCESDLHGRLAELVAAGVLEEAAVAGERGYRVTDDGQRAVAALTGARSESA